MYKVFLLILIYFFAGCAPAVQVKPSEQLPKWVDSPDALRGVGSSEVNFQGVYTQRLAAVNKAKSDLAHSLKSYITSVYNSSEKINEDKILNKNHNKITALSEIFLNESYQVDAYFDENRKLYVLVELSKPRLNNLLGIKSEYAKTMQTLPKLNTRAFDKDELMQSRCYPQNILKTIDTKADLYQNKPVWFFRPNQNTYQGSVGIAEKESLKSYEEQKKVATILAKSALSKRKKTQIASEHEALEILHNDTSGEIFETSSIVRSANRSQPTTVKDIWLDPQSCELYVWIVNN
ncbi:LPP20 family lipoprotein [Candidatus Sulfurimonas baltica]|uniref:Lipoprotein LPP20-like domain-containing protein n=1 Tax=Candidatus Sulfurimonas baltica TaxID=2740404 RepID=A0A7S7LTL5_9BACT|nr:LPP20 family lipoprotein [Candidatus Sulfurimonas baltica]QOY51309.1 hypothetical protein HUE88_09245 [Candidatus Sulfurimonas baltica]